MKWIRKKKTVPRFENDLTFHIGKKKKNVSTSPFKSWMTQKSSPPMNLETKSSGLSSLENLESVKLARAKKIRLYNVQLTV